MKFLRKLLILLTFIVFVLERKLVQSIQRHYSHVIDAFDLTDVIDVLVSEECLTPAQHTAVRKTEGHFGIEKVSSCSHEALQSNLLSFRGLANTYNFMKV